MVCRRCGESKPQTDFNRDASMASGRRSICRPCQVAQNRQIAERAPDARRENQRRRYQRELERLGRPRPSKTGSPQKMAAKGAVWRALERGDLVRPDACSACGADEAPVHGHHADYSESLKVEWLCARCHGRRHTELRAA